MRLAINDNWPVSYEFACHSAACAPPVGGSLPGPSGGSHSGPDPRRLGRPHSIPVADKPGWHHVYDERGNSRGMSSAEQAERYVKRRQSQIKGTATKRAQAAKLKTAVAEPKFKTITKDQARGDSRAVSHEEFQRLAAEGQKQLDGFADRKSPHTGLDEHWDTIKVNSYHEVTKPWGGATIDAHTGQPLPQGANVYAITVKSGQQTVSVPEGASRAEFSRAMDEAKSRFGPILEREDHHLGVFHDDENHRIDIDPVLVVRNRADVDTIGAASHAIGGAYNFADGNGYWPPHVGE